MKVRRGVAWAALTAINLVLDDRKEPGARTQNVEIIGDLGGELVQGLGDFVAAERRQALQPQFENGRAWASESRQVPSSREHMARIGDKGDQGRHVARGPVRAHQGRAGRRRHRRRCGSGG